MAVFVNLSQLIKDKTSHIIATLTNLIVIQSLAPRLNSTWRSTCKSQLSHMLPGISKAIVACTFQCWTVS